jgi:hypothetical protein
MRLLIRALGATVATGFAMVVVATPALAHECVNASKQNQAAGVQVVIDAGTGEIVWTTPGLANRLDQGLVSPDGVGFHGLVGLDLNGDGVVDVATYIVGPDDEIPPNAQANGDPCHGITDIGTFFSQCVG